MSKPSKKYWEERAEQREIESQVIADVYLAKMADSLREAQRGILNEIESFYSRYATDNVVTLAEARKLLTAKEVKEFNAIDLKRFRAMSLAGNPEYENILNAVSYRVRISRLEVLNAKINMEMIALYGGPNGLQEYTATGLADVYQSSYYKSMFDIAQAGVIGGSVAVITDTTMKEVLTYNWSGKEFSERIWGQQAATMDAIRKELEKNFAGGRSIAKTTKAIMEKTDVARSKVETLVRTESNFFHGLAAQNSYTDAGIEKYEILATLDGRTSKICRRQDGKVYDSKDYEPGKTANPFHPNCRTTTIAWFNESEYMDDEQRQSDRGLIQSMTYQEYYDKYVG